MDLQVDRLIESAYQIINVATEDKNLSGYQKTQALGQLNIIIDLLSGNSQQISFSKTLSFSLTIGKQVYTIGDGGDFGDARLITLEKAVLVDGEIQYPLSILSDNAFYGISRNLNTNGKPSRLFLQNNLANLSELHFFIIPDKAYEVTLKGKFVLPNVELDANIENVPAYYYGYLQYYLAKVMHTFYPSSSWSQESESLFRKLESECLAANDIDLDVRTFKLKSANGYGSYNIYAG